MTGIFEHKNKANNCFYQSACLFSNRASPHGNRHEDIQDICSYLTWPVILLILPHSTFDIQLTSLFLLPSFSTFWSMH